ncbi:hypothetical protein LXA43DRAFT_1096893 [Ganoderma leucocontextum]|nr:hypothetical protein LXA43DRAFT_1096893 [Ganoderma leucocontextum]
MSESTDMESRASPSHQASSNPAEQHGSPPESTKPGTSKNGAKWTSSGIITQQEKDNAYLKTAKIVREYSDDLVDGWNKEIDTLLVFAALYSAILTAFNVQSYQYLQPAAPDPTLAVLQQILSLQLNSLAITPPINSIYGASTSTANDQAGTQARAPSWAVALNILWFSALILSLASTSIGIMTKQWLREYQSGCSGVAQEYALLRQLRLNNLEKWHVAEIVAILPVLLQLSLWLFFGGLLVLLWQLDPTVATVASALVGIVMSAVVGMTILPVICRGCSYLSPQAFVFLHIKQHVESGLKFWSKTVGLLLFLPFVQVAGLLMGHGRLTPHRYFILVARWFQWAHSTSHNTVFTTWRGEEQTIIQESSSKLVIDTVILTKSTGVSHAFALSSTDIILP